MLVVYKRREKGRRGALDLMDFYMCDTPGCYGLPIAAVKSDYREDGVRRYCLPCYNKANEEALALLDEIIDNPDTFKL